MTKGIVVLAQNSYDSTVKFERQFNDIEHVDIWYDEVTHVVGQHVWLDNTVYKMLVNQEKETEFNIKNVDIIIEDICLINDKNKSLKFENPTTGKLALNNNIIMLCKYSTISDYVLQACLLAMSLHTYNTTPISLITDDKVPEEYVSLFDKIIPIPFGDSAEDSEWKVENRWKIYHASPYDETIVMDTDMLVLQNIDVWWDFLANYEVFYTSNVLTYTGEIADTSYYRKTFIDNSLPNLFCGLHYFKKCEFAQEFYDWLEIVIDSWEVFYKQQLVEASRPKHVSIDVCSAIVAKILDCESNITNKVAKFPSFTHMKPYCQGWDEVQASWQNQIGIYISKDGNVKLGNYAQTGILHYTEKDFIENSPALERYRNLSNV